MYCIVDGRVKVHDGDVVFREMGRYDILGELAVFDPEPRSATVTAIDPTYLFRLDADTCYELLAEHIDFVRAINHLLCNRIRELSYRPTHSS